MLNMPMRKRGFTLVELIVVIVVTGVLAAGMMAYFKPAINNYLAVGRRASLANMADGALRTISRDIRAAVPNSVRLATSSCFEVVPSSDGGRYRSAPDTTWDTSHPAAPSMSLDTSTTVTTFDVLTPYTASALPAAGDWVVVDNQNADDVYAGSNRAAIASVSTPPAFDSSLGEYRITLTAATQFPLGYDGGRFVIVPDAQQAVFYVCSGAGKDASGTGTGTLYRYSHYGFNASAPGACMSGGSPATLATKVSSCTFTYSANQGATQQSGYVEAQLQLRDQDEPVTLSFGAHVDNVP